MKGGNSFTTILHKLRSTPFNRIPAPQPFFFQRAFYTPLLQRKVLSGQRLYQARNNSTTAPYSTPFTPSSSRSMEGSSGTASTSAYEELHSPPRSATSSPALSEGSLTPSEDEAEPQQQPSYELTFTCKPCRHRSTHTISKLGYHSGTVLITCPGCKNRHVISDHLKIFADKGFTIEDLMRRKGELVKRGSIDGDGDVEFWRNGGRRGG
ncbi:MAG: hypothetical protein Q9217_005539 [Psora testacea]